MRTLALAVLVSAALSAEPAAQTPASRPALIRQVRTLLAQRQSAKAVASLRAALEKAEGDAQLHYWLGVALHAGGDVGEALPHYEKAQENATFRARALYNIARVHAKRGALERAFAKLDEAREAGFADRARMLADAEWTKHRAHERFTSALPPILRGNALFREDVRVVHDIHGESAGDQFGWVARRIGDVDGDGVVDFATSAPSKAIGSKGSAGRAYAYSSKTGEKLWTLDGDVTGARLGNGLAGCGDVDGDGVPDVVVGAPGARAAYVCAGDSGRVLHELDGSKYQGFGTKVCAVEDLDGDKRPEICVGAPGADAVLVYGSEAFQLLFSIRPPASETKGNRGFGMALDGFVQDSVPAAQRSATKARLLVVGAPKARSGRGCAYVYELRADGAELAFEVRGDAGSRGLGQYFVAVLRDCDGDAHPDVFVSDWGNSGAAPRAGKVFVHSGRSGKQLFAIAGEQAGEGFGTSMSQAGDVDGDGASDLIVGAWQHASAARSGGRCTLHSGRDSRVLASYTCMQPGDTFGFDAQGIGDVDGDGAIDFLCTSAWSATHGARCGRVLILAGPAQSR